MSAWAEFINQVLQSSIWEWIAVITSVLYVIFAARKMIICWLFAIITSGLYIYICFSYNLYLETILQVFYLIMGVVGWVLWNNKTSGKPTQKSEDLLDDFPTINKKGEITRWRVTTHVINIVISGVLTLLLGMAFSDYTDQENPFIDAFTTVFSLVATYMVIKKVLENWLYWIFIDAVSIYLYADRGLYLSAVLFAFFTVLAVIGYISWRRKYQSQL
ncbi:MAG: nicotinamide riboside transporter PnuC [Crocinitomicaceae bacterium]|nr:nicotinamide riboside transporter PnuC [Crocinitomicaceae bacterium]